MAQYLISHFIGFEFIRLALDEAPPQKYERKKTIAFIWSLSYIDVFASGRNKAQIDKQLSTVWHT